MVNTSGLEEKVRVRAVENMERASDELRRQIEHDAPRDTGQLSVAPVTSTSHSERQVVSRVNVERLSPTGFDIARAQDEGTGEYADPPRGRIYPRRPGGRLTFFWAKIGAVVSFASVAGTPRTEFFSRAVAQWKDRLSEEYQR